jgi:hypothetical protein
VGAVFNAEENVSSRQLDLDVLFRLDYEDIVMNLNELKIMIAEVLEEAKKKKEKSDRLKAASGGAKSAYGYYDESLDFSAPLGGYNLYRSQGAVNWGPYTGPGPHIDQNFANPNTRLGLKEEAALRQVVREVIEFGLIPPDSAWAPLMESNSKPVYENVWQEALDESHWFMQHRENNNVPEGGPLKAGSITKTEYGKVGGHGVPAGGKGVKKAKPRSKNGRSA